METENNSRAGRAILARLQWEDEDDVKKVKQKRRQTIRQIWESGTGKVILGIALIGVALSVGLFKGVMGSETVRENRLRGDMVEELIRQELLEQAKEGDEFAKEELRAKGVKVDDLAVVTGGEKKVV